MELRTGSHNGYGSPLPNGCLPERQQQTDDRLIHNHPGSLELDTGDILPEQWLLERVNVRLYYATAGLWGRRSRSRVHYTTT